MSAGFRGAVVTTVLTLFFVPVFKHHGVSYRVESKSVHRSVARCAPGTRWRPSVDSTVTGGPPHTPAPYTKVITTVFGKCVPAH